MLPRLLVLASLFLALPTSAGSDAGGDVVDDSGYFDMYGNIDGIVADMLKDEPRMKAYHDAIVVNGKEDFAGKVVLDVGSGIGTLSVWAAQAGAKRVYAVEGSNSASTAEKLVNRLGLSSVVTVIRGRLEDIELPESVDIIVSEWMGFLLVYEAMLQSVLYARDRWLKPDGILLPSSAEMLIAPLRAPVLHQTVVADFLIGAKQQNWEAASSMSRRYGLDVSVLDEDQRAERLQRSHAMMWQGEIGDASGTMIGPPSVLLAFDLKTVRVEEVFERRHRFDLAALPAAASDSAEPVSALCAWFTVRFCPTVQGSACVDLSTAPYAAPTHWGQTIFLPPQPIGSLPAAFSLSISMFVHARDSQIVRWGARSLNVTIERLSSPTMPDCVFDAGFHFFGEYLLTRPRAGGTFVPDLQLWFATPALVTKLAHYLPTKDDSELLTSLRGLVADAWDRFHRSSPRGNRSVADQNAAFWEWQEHQSRVDTWRETPAGRQLVTALAVATESYLDWLEEGGAVPRNETVSADKLSVWISLHEQCTYHPSHVHPGAAVSGVYYLQVPRDTAGQMVFSDPRGRLPPFASDITIMPEEGRLVLFPPWLSHEVTPTCNRQDDEPRISIAFNYIPNGEFGDHMIVDGPQQKRGASELWGGASAGFTTTLPGSAFAFENTHVEAAAAAEEPEEARAFEDATSAIVSARGVTEVRASDLSDFSVARARAWVEAQLAQSDSASALEAQPLLHFLQKLERQQASSASPPPAAVPPPSSSPSTAVDGAADLKAFYSRWNYPSQTDASDGDYLHLTDFTSLAHAEHFGLRSDWVLPTSEPLRILVAGCAAGNDAVVLALQINEYVGSRRGDVLCVDQSVPSLAIAAAKAERANVSHLVRTLELDLNQLDARVHGTFDYIISSGVLHHQSSPERGLAAIKRVLKPGGVMGLMMHASHGMGSVVEVHELLQRNPLAHMELAERLDTARGLQLSLRGSVPPSLHYNLERNLDSDESAADFYLVPYNRAYSVRQLAAWLATSGICAGRLEPSWRYDLEHVPATPLHGGAPPSYNTSVLASFSRLDRLAFADSYYGVAINHRFIARVAANERERSDGVCDEVQSQSWSQEEDEKAPRRDPRSGHFAPLWMWVEMRKALPSMLAMSNRTERLEHALALLMPGPFGHVRPDSIEGARRLTPEAIAAHVERELDAFPEDASRVAALADGCTSLSDILAGQQRPDARDLRMYYTLERFFGLRLARIEHFCIE